MNAIDMQARNAAARPVAAPHATHTFKLLLKREFWEHKGGFFWAPLIAGAHLPAAEPDGHRRRRMRCARFPTTPRSTSMAAASRSTDSTWPVDREDQPEELREFGGVDRRQPAAWRRPGRSSCWPSSCSSTAWAACTTTAGTAACCSGSRCRCPTARRCCRRSPARMLVAPIAGDRRRRSLTVFGFVLIVSVDRAAARRQPDARCCGPGQSAEGHRATCSPSMPVYTLWALPTVGWLMLCSAWATPQAVPVGGDDAGVRRHLRQLVRPDAGVRPGTRPGSGRTSSTAAC